MTCDQHVVWATGHSGTGQLGPKLREMGSAARRERKHWKISYERLNSSPIFEPSG
jgi:hypothetical protein